MSLTCKFESHMQDIFVSICIFKRRFVRGGVLCVISSTLIRLNRRKVLYALLQMSGFSGVYTVVDFFIFI